MTARLDVVLLAGGRGERLGGVSKADVELGGVRLVDRALDAVRSALTPDVTLGTIVVVGDVVAPEGVLTTREDPPFGGPAAGVAAGVAALADPLAPWCLVLACDLADPAPGLRLLGAAVMATDVADGVWLLDADDHPQWLFAVYRREALVAALAGEVRDRSVGSVLGPLACTGIPAGDDLVADIDTWDDHQRWERRAAVIPEGEQP